jgi:asparagine synthase (glutamine-hydrolysing)
MSAIAGILRLDGQPVERALLEALAKPAPGSLVDALGFWQEGSVGLGHALARITPEAAREQQPLVDAASGCVIVLDGRLDNRAELRGSLGEYERLLGQETDAAYALAGYLRWGDRAPEHLLGDFAFAVWDPRARQLLLACDPLGMRPLYYSTWGHRLTFASTLEQMLNDRALPREIDEAVLLQHLYPDSSAPRQGTCYREIRRLPGGHRLVAGERGPRRERYWRWPEQPTEPRQTRADDAEEFRAVFAEAVRCRLRSTAPVGVTLSGGLDSGAIASTAGYLHEQTDAPRIHAYSFVFDRFASCDERVYSQAAAARYGFPHTCVLADDCWSLARFEEWRPVFSEPHFGGYEDAWYKVLAQARADGVRAMLTGDGGDLLVGGSPLHLSDWLLQGRWAAVYTEVRARARRAGQSPVRGVAPVLFCLLPVGLQRVLARSELPPTEPWVPAHLRRRYGPSRLLPLRAGRHAWWYLLRDQIDQLGHGHHNAFKDRQMRRFGLEVRQPFFDVRLIELVLRTPPEAFYRNGTTKVLLREALHDVLPPVIRDRGDKANLSPLLHFGLRERRRAFVEALLEDSELERRGYVVPGPWKASIRRYLDHGGPPYWAYWSSLTLEMWLRTQAGRLPPLE